MISQAVIRVSRDLAKQSRCFICTAISIKKLHTSPAPSSHNHASPNPNIDTTSTSSPDEIEKFRNLANSWWNEVGEFKALHSMNPLRIQLIQNGLINSRQLKSLEFPEPFKGLNLLDVGCGGGILSEPLARLGGNVTGIDATEEGINVAKSHAEFQKLNINYICSTIEHFLDENSQHEASFDAIVMSEVIEHVINPPLFIATAAKLLKPKGSLFITTMNRTWQSYVGAIIFAEYFFQLVPRGTHQWKKFLAPEEVAAMLSENNLRTRLVTGTYYYPLENRWEWAKSTKVNYALHAVKNEN